jgi:hypothetical protein
MLSKLGRPNHSTVVAYLALFVALGGTGAYASHELIDSSDVVADSLTGSDIKGRNATSTQAGTNGSIGTAEISGQPSNAALGQPAVNGSLTTYDIQDRSLRAGDLGLNSLTASELGSNSVSTSELKDGSVTLSKLEPKWNATETNNQSGPLPVDWTFSTHGGWILITVHGSAYRKPVDGQGRMAVKILVDQGFGFSVFDQAELFTNETDSHKALVPNAVVLHPPAGQHKLRLEPINMSSCGGGSGDLYCTATDGNDFFKATIVEFPG